MKDFFKLDWLWSFDSDGYRLAAIAVVSLAVIVLACVKPISAAWSQDRRDQRKYDLERLKLLQKLQSEAERRQAERLDFDR